ncbi:diacylglycerol kinase family protein [uncultured Anaerococcus sp.]|mgnify:CR=1 FL=1|uniref:diacylglycerol/lipid kinase family protein n=1 Tax=uncultured Anaerococcus sp. TaxID=293428 RepID=UPI00261900CD|nr:diacylglycerol kinase family protein [uncultured Anaerococcus sp.]
MKKLFLISSHAGASEYRFSKEHIEKVYKDHGKLDEILVKETAYKGHLEEIVNDFINSDYKDKVIIVLGGDGSLHEVVNLCVGHDVAIGLIPTGTGNDFAKNFSYKDFKIKDSFNIDIRPIDLIDVNGKYCINVTSLGFDTDVLKKAYEYLEKDKSIGKRAYIKAVIDRMKHPNYQKLSIDLDLVDNSKVTLNNEFLISAICNGGFYGSGFNPAPSGKIDDGIINFVVAYKFPKRIFPSLIIKYKKGEHQSSKYLDEFKIRGGKIKSKTPFLANIDGEIFTTDQIKFEVIPNSLNWAYFV